MTSRFKLLLTAAFGVILLGLMFVPSHPASAELFKNAKDEACSGIALSSNTTGCANTSNNLTGVLRTALEILSIVVGVIAVIMIIIAGIKYITSQGESASVASAKNTLLYAVIGLVIVAFAQVIVTFVITKTKP